MLTCPKLLAVLNWHCKISGTILYFTIKQYDEMGGLLVCFSCFLSLLLCFLFGWLVFFLGGTGFFLCVALNCVVSSNSRDPPVSASSAKIKGVPCHCLVPIIQWWGLAESRAGLQSSFELITGYVRERIFLIKRWIWGSVSFVSAWISKLGYVHRKSDEKGDFTPQSL